MAARWGSAALSIISLLLLTGNVQSSKLNVPRVLLPLFKQFSSNFTLEVTESGCYKWTSSRIDVVQVHPVNVDHELGCSTHAIVSAVSKDDVRNTAIILAEEVHSGQVLRCDVIVDVIATMNIVTTTRELYMEEAPEAFEVRAYDDQGNEFTSLEGVEFQWSLSNTNANNVLRFITFGDSPYETPSTIAEFEAKGLKGHMVLLEGIKTGSAKVSVRMPHPEYQKVKPIEVQLMVVANLIIEPADVHLLNGDTIHYRILQVQHGKLVEILMPSPQYYLEIEDKTMGIACEKTGIVTAKKLGKTKILLHDRNVDEQEADIKIPTAQLTIVDPAYLTLALLPHRNWAVMVAERYEIIVEIYDSADRKVFIGDGVNVTMSIPEEYFHVRQSTANNTHHFGWPVANGTAIIKATLDHVCDGSGHVHYFSPKISAQAEMNIYERIVVTPAEVVLPWDPAVRPKYEVPIVASGGDGSYLWGTANGTIAAVTQSGVVKTSNVGYAEVTAAMPRNHHNKATAQFHILPPRHLEIIEYVLEAEIGVPIFLHVALFADRPIASDGERERLTLIPFTQCKDIPFHVEVAERNFRYDPKMKAAPVGISCTTLAIIGTSIGTTVVTVSYTYEGRLMEDTITVATYNPLKPLYPETGETVLAVGSSRTVVFTGGPRPWLGRTAEHVRQVDLTHEDDERPMTAREVTHPAVPDKSDTYVYQVTCRRIGEVVMQLTVTNTPPLKHCKRAESTSSVKVFCAKPRSVYLRPEIKIAKGDCPMNLNAGRVVAQNYKDIEVTVTVKDADERKFENITSLFVKWEVSDPSLADVCDKGTILSDNRIEGEFVLPFRQYQRVIPKGLSGTVDVTASVVSYHSNLLRNLRIEAEYPPFGIKDDKGIEVTPEIKSTVTLILVNDSIIVPDQATIFNHPKNKVFLQVSQGSGFYEFVLNSDDMAEVQYIRETRVIEIVPLTDGLLKIALVDLCLVSKPALAEIQIVGVKSIKVEAPDRVERGKCMIVVVKLFDSLDNQMPFPDPSLLELVALPESAIIGIKHQFKERDPKNPDMEMRFTVTGLDLGDTSLTFAAGTGPREVRSVPVPIQVFPPLRLFPRNVTLIAGALFQVTSRGGPQPDANIEYTMSSKVATVSRTGVVEGLQHGDTVLVGRAIKVNANGQRIIYSSDSVDIHVVPLTGVKIHAPITRIRTGATMPVWAAGIPDQVTPLMLGSAKDPLGFKWTLEVRDVGQLRNVFHETGIDVGDSDKISMRFTASKPGRTTIHLNMSCPAAMTGSSSTKSFFDSLEIEVFEELRLTRPPSAAGPQTQLVVIAPETSVQLRTNREAASQLSFVVVDVPMLKVPNPEADTEEIMNAMSSTTSVIRVDSKGHVTSIGPVGRAIVIVSCQEDFGLRQYLSVFVEVKQVAYMMLNVYSRLQVVPRENTRVRGLPQGLEIELSASFHDNTGSTFTSSRADLKMRTNRFDLTQLARGEDNGTVHAKLVHKGGTMLKVWDDATMLNNIVDYVKISTEDIIFPEMDKEALTVGDVVCLSMPLVPLMGDSRGGGRWSTDNEAVLRLDSDHGLGVAEAGGAVTVQYHFTPDSQVNADLEVVPVQEVRFLPSDQMTVSNASPDVPFKVPLVLIGDDKSKTHNLVAGGRGRNKCTSPKKIKVYPFICKLSFTTDTSPLEVLAVYPSFDMNTGEYSCDIISAGPATLDSSLMRTNVSLQAFAYGVASEKVELPFYPAFYLQTRDIVITSSRVTAYITLTGVPDVLVGVEVLDDGSGLLVVGKAERKDANTIAFPVQLDMNHWQRSATQAQITLNVVSSLTRQSVEVPVKVKMGGVGAGGGGGDAGGVSRYDSAPCLANQMGGLGAVFEFFYHYRHTVGILVSVLVIVFTSIYFYSRFIVPTHGNAPQSNNVVLPSNAYPGFGGGGFQPNTSGPRSPFASDTSPVYGDPRLSFQSPERRSSSRRFQ